MNVSIQVYEPLVIGSLNIADITRQISSYSHSIKSIGGYDTATISINDNQNNVEDWIRNGLGRHIEVYNPDLAIIWEGFVNQIQANLGPLTFTIGPLLDVGNYVAVSYVPTDTATSPPTRGTETLTSFASSANSQAKYGRIEKIISGNSAKDLTDAEAIRDKHFNDPSGPWPATSRNSNISGGSGPSVQLSCLGYWHWLTTYYYTDANTGDRARSTKIQDVLGAEPNTGIFSADYSSVTSNTDTIEYENDGRETAQTILLEVNRTGISGNRSIMGFYAGRKFFYESVPTDFEYVLRLSDNKGITNRNETIVPPWDLQPKRWIFYSDFLVGQAVPTSLAELQQDLRAGFIEQTTFNAPYGASINGIKLDDLGLFLEKLNLKNGGI